MDNVGINICVPVFCAVICFQFSCACTYEMKCWIINMPANLEYSAMATGLEKVNFHFNPKERQCQEYLSYWTIALIFHASRLLLKIFQARLQQYVSWELPNVQAGFRKGRGTGDQIANIHWILEKAREFHKKYLLLLY